MLWSKTPRTRKSYSHDSESHSKITPAPRKWGSRMVKNWCLYSDLSFQRILMILVSKFSYSCVVSRTIIKKLKLFKRVKNDQKPNFGTSIAFYLSFQPILMILVSKCLYSWVVSRKIIKSEKNWIKNSCHNNHIEMTSLQYGLSGALYD